MSDDAASKDEVTYGEYKGNPIITLPLGQRGFSFGISKARAIVAHIDEIRAFVEKHDID